MDDGDIILNLLLQLGPTVRMIIEWVAIVATLLIAIIIITPWKGDDQALEQVQKMPIIGKLVAALLKFSPIKFGKKD